MTTNDSFNKENLKNINKDDMKNIVSEFLSFDKLISPRIIRVFYFLSIIINSLSALLMLLVAVLSIFQGQIISAIAMIIAAFVVFILSVLGTRILVEFVLVTFKNNQYLRKIAERS